MQIKPFELERYFAEHEFRVRFLLSASDCESLTLQELLALADADGLALWDGLSLAYTESQGHPLLRREIARQHQTVTPDDVLVAAPEEAIFIAMNTLLAPGDHVLVTFPAYQSLYQVAEAAGCTVTRWPLTPDGAAGWRLDIDFLRDHLRPETRLIVVNFPHNPTGHLPTRGELDTIVEIAAGRGIYIFSDEMYRLLEYDPARRLPSVCDLYERGIALAGLSKAYALPGLRIGWLATRDREVLNRCAAFKDYTTICSSAPSEVLGIIALRAAARIVERNLAIIRSNLSAAERFFAQDAGLFAWLPPRAGSVAFPRLAERMPVAGFCRDLLAAQNVMVVPGDLFGHAGNHFRVGLGRRNLPEALERVQRYLDHGGLRQGRTQNVKRKTQNVKRKTQVTQPAWRCHSRKPLAGIQRRCQRELGCPIEAFGHDG